MKISILLIAFFALVTTTGCGKDKEDEPEVPTTITITSPIAGTIFINGSSLKVEGEMFDNNVLASAKVEIRNKSTGAVLFQQTSSTGNVGFYRFLWNWTVTGVTTTFTATVKVIAKDKLSNEVFKEVDVQMDL